MSDILVEKKGVRKWVVACLVAGAVACLGYFAWSWNYYYVNAPERTGRDMTYLWQWKMYAKGMKVAYEADTYGGATPEETLQLFVEALRAGDIALASKYYIPEKQSEVFADLTKGKENSSLAETAKVYSQAKSATTESGDEYFMSVKDGKYDFEIVFRKNERTNKWKISEP